MPVMLFCLQIDQKLIDANLQLTGNYMEEMTRQMTAESTFESITYLNGSSEWIAFDSSRTERFFLLNMKCFRMKIDQFHFSTETQALKVNFKRESRYEM